MHFDQFLGSLMTRIVEKLLDDGRLADGEHFTVQLAALNKGQPKIDPIATLRKVEPGENVLITAVASPIDPIVGIETVETAIGLLSEADKDEIVAVPNEATVQPGPTKGHETLEIIVDSVENLVKPQSRSLRDYVDLERVGEATGPAPPILMRRGALEQARRSAAVGACKDEEIGGFLLGNVFQDPDTDQMFVEIGEVAEADQARGTYVSITFDYNSWRQVLDRIGHDFPGRLPIGWYHSHLVSQAFVMPVAGTEDEYTASNTPHFSAADLFIHRNFFPDPWHVALVLDLRCKREAFFAWQCGQITYTGGFYLYGT